MIAASPMPAEYPVAMHFVASILTRYGVEKFKRLRAEVPEDAGLEAFASAFASVYGVSLDEALSEMDAPMQGKLPPYDGCSEDAETIPWIEDGYTEAELHGQCGDPSFVGGGFVAGRPGFAKSFALDVPEAGLYRARVTGPGDMPPEIQLLGCTASNGGHGGGEGEAVLLPGRYSLGVGYPQGPEPKGEAHFSIEFDSPLPP